MLLTNMPLLHCTRVVILCLDVGQWLTGHPYGFKRVAMYLRATHLLLVIIAIHASPRRRFCFQPLSFSSPNFYLDRLDTTHLLISPNPQLAPASLGTFFLYLSEGRHRRETREAATTAGRIEHTHWPIGAVRYADRQKLFITALLTHIYTTTLFNFIPFQFFIIMLITHPPILKPRKQLLRAQNPIEMQIRFRAAPWTATVEMSLVRLCPVVRYEVRAKAVEGWCAAGGLALVMARYSYVFLHLCCDCGDGGGVVGFWNLWAEGFFSLDDAFGGRSGACEGFDV